MDETSAIIIADACRDILEAVFRLNGRLSPKKRSALHLFIAFKARDIAIEVERSCNADDDIMKRLRSLEF